MDVISGDDHVADFSENIMRVIDRVCELQVPLVVDVAVGNRWSEL